MYKISLENKHGSLTFNGGGPFQIVDMQGLSPPETIINTYTKALCDGEFISSTKLKSRVIELAITITHEAEKNRQEIYKILRTGGHIRVDYINGFRDVYIDGVVQNINVDYFNRTQIITVTIFCARPLWVDKRVFIAPIGTSNAGFKFPFNNGVNSLIFSTSKERNAIIENTSGADIGLIATLAIKTPIKRIELHEESTNKSMYLEYDFLRGDEVKLSTGIGEKSCELTRDGTKKSIINSVKGDWLYLVNGLNTFTYLVDNTKTEAKYNAVNITIEYKNYYEGV